LLRAIYKQPHPEKPPLGPNPFKSTEAETTVSSSGETAPPPSKPAIIQQDQDVHVWEKETAGRFEYLCANKLNKDKENPFSNGFWQACFVLLSRPDIKSLKEFL
jgi:hypothetical protein